MEKLIEYVKISVAQGNANPRDLEILEQKIKEYAVDKKEVKLAGCISFAKTSIGHGNVPDANLKQLRAKIEALVVPAKTKEVVKEVKQPEVVVGSVETEVEVVKPKRKRRSPKKAETAITEGE